MAQPDSVQANGIPGPAPDQAGSPQPVVPVKRKRDSEDEANGDEPDKMDVDGESPQVPREDEKAAIRNYFTVLTSLDATPSILKRPLPDPEAEQRDAKRQKSTDSIQDKVSQDSYAHLDELAADVVAAASDQLKELQSAAPEDGKENKDKSVGTAVVRTKKFRDEALDLLRREISYPRTAANIPDTKPDVESASDNAVLTVYGLAGHGKQLFSSLPKKTPGAETSTRPSPLSLPPGVSTTIIMPSRQSERTATLGELFSSSRPLPPLQPPKQPKQTVKGNVLNFQHPDPAGKSKFFNESYSSKKVAVGYFLDYTNATPSSKTKTRQRERAQSLAGRRPSSAELEVSEMEMLFRSAFSSFAPCRDDSASIIPSSHAGRLHWQLLGQRSFNKMIDSELQAFEDDQPSEQTPEAEEIDEEFVNEAIEKWDEWLVDPALQDMDSIVAKPQDKKDLADKEVDELLGEVTDMIETLLSYQRIRNLTLPSSQNRYSGDPVGGDMLSHGVVSAPTEEETMTYETLKAQLSLIINTLPPYAVAKLNGDQLEQLLVSTKLEIRTDQYKGVMEDDAATQAARMRQQQNVAAAAPQSRPAPHRTPSASTPYNHNQYAAGQYGTPSRTPSIAPTNYYRSGQQPAMPPQQGPMPRPVGTPHHMPPHQTPRPGQPGGYRPPNGYTSFAQHVGKAQTPYGHQGAPYGSQQRPPQYPGYTGTPQHGTPNARYQQPYQQQYQQAPSTPSQPNYGGYYPNGANNMQQRMSPQIPQGQYQSPTPIQQQRHHAPPTPHQNMPGTPINRQQYPNGGLMPQHTPNHGMNAMTGYNAAVYKADHARMVEQARYRAQAQQQSSAFGSKIQNGYEARLAAMPADDNYDGSPHGANVRARMAAGSASKPQSPVGSVGRSNGTPPIPHKVTPVPVPVIPQQQQRKPA
ncbi:hypothetical protein CSOJ01_03469 [Colletotrichum sojae]|uniref:Uncharacterized protein n=1 Tax=Colletotrichum sojae TaxID=2175907 RepID=A0A8H6N098_9PEZI|nr:hypothetical protein CSOJ01_03469 [Colletotrichum sojae]